MQDTSVVSERHGSAGDVSPELGARIHAARVRVVWDCTCPDVYFCAESNEVECPRHSGFVTCCDRVEEHVALR